MHHKEHDNRARCRDGNTVEIETADLPKAQRCTDYPANQSADDAKNDGHENYHMFFVGHNTSGNNTRNQTKYNPLQYAHLFSSFLSFIIAAFSVGLIVSVKASVSYAALKVLGNQAK